MTTETGTAFGRALEFERHTLALVGAELSEIPDGWVAWTPSLPLVSALNHVEVRSPIELADALTLVERHLRELPFHQLLVHGGGDGLAPEPEALELMRDWLAEGEEMQEDPEVHDQAVEACRRIWRARNARRFGVLDRTGALAGITMLFSDGVVAQVEDVYVVPSERGRGLGRALVTHAAVQAVEAGHELVFIVADDEGWPKHLYASVGFEPAGRTSVFDRSA